jgi:hypothetical protein
MSQRIDVPGMGIVEFPDGMTDAAMSAAIKKALVQQQPQQTGAQLQAANTGPGEAFLAAAGKKTDDILSGLTQLYLGARGETSALDALKSQQEQKKAEFAPLQQARPWSTGFGSALPSMALPATSILGAGAAAALPDLLAYGSPEERLKAGAISGAGGMAGAAAGKLIARALKPSGVGNAGVSAETREAADRLGYQMTPGQATQNPAMQAFENYLAKSPGSAGTMQAINQGNQTAINKAGASAIGQTADVLEGPVFKSSSKAIGDEFRRLESISRPVLGNKFVDALDVVASNNAARGPFANTEISSVVDKALDLAAKGQLTGKAYKEIRSTLASKAYEATDSTVKDAYRSVFSALDDAAKGSLSAENQAAWDAARSQWSAWKTLAKGNVTEGGNISAARLASALRNQSDAFRQGAQGPLQDIGRIGESLKGVPNPTSGQLLQQAQFADPRTLFGAVQALGNKTAVKAYTSPTAMKWLSGGYDIGPTGKSIVMLGGRPVGIEALKKYLGVEEN